MNSRVSWSVDGIDPSVRERAEAAARRAGMSLSDWLNSTLGESSPPDFRNPTPDVSASRDVDDIHQRLDSITRQIERISQPMPRNEATREQGVARQLNDAISRLDARLSQISNPQAARASQNRQQRQTQAVERAANQVYSQAPAPQSYRASPPLSPGFLDVAVAEIAARQHELDAPPSRAMPQRHVPPAAPMAAPAPPPAPPGPDFSALERHLFQITSQIESLQRPDIERSIGAFRQELGEIRAAITEAMPRRAIDSIEAEIRILSQRIEDNRQSGVDSTVFTNIENALNEIRDVLRSLKSAEQLAGYDQAIRNLGAKLDTILRANDDPGTVQQLEQAIAALRGIVANVASNDALVRLSDDVQMLSSRVDQVARASSSNVDSFAALEQRIAALTSAMESRERPEHQDNSEQIEAALRALSDRIDRMQVGNDSASALAHLEQRVSYLLERLESSSADRNSGNLGRVEEGLQDILRHLENQHAALASFADNQHAALASLVQNQHAALGQFADNQQAVLASFASNQQRGEPAPGDDGMIDLVKRELSDIRFSQSKSDRQTQDSLEAVHAALVSFADNQQAAFASFASNQQRGMPGPGDDGMIDLVKRELSDIRFSQSKTDRQTQDSLETVNSTLGHVVDRLALIEGDLRTVRSAPVPQPEPPQAAPRLAMAPQPKPELPNPAAAELSAFQAERVQEERPPAPHFDAAPRDFHAAEPEAAMPPQAAAEPPPLAISEILLPSSSPRAPALAPDLPPDHPLEPGTRPGARPASPSERIAASESAISEIPATPRPPVSSSSFIAAARRAAQAAAAQPLNEKARAKAEKTRARETARQAAKEKDKDKEKDKTKDGAKGGSSSVTSKIRSLLVATSVVVIVVGTFKMAMNYLDGGNLPFKPSMEKSSEQPSTLTPADSSAKAPAPQQSAPAPEQPAPAPSLTSPAPIGRQSLNKFAPATTDSVASVEIPQGASAAPASGDDITGSIPRASADDGKLAPAQIPQDERLPDQIGGANLRAAALKGDATAAYEVGVRFAEGKGVSQNLEEAAKWYDRAAQAGIIPAVFRLGTLYEKGMGVKKDVELARRYYLQAAERGNAKAMHNLAVLDADGGGKGPNYKSASQWFRKAADHGVADSQFNLGILYARGIGVEQNLAESFKWFTLAAAQGDTDASHKRDDIAKRLDAQSLAAAKLAIQTFTAEPQPDDAVNVATPRGGWDGTPAAPATAAKPASKPAAKRATTARL
jgi:localization factor PodJL